MVLVNKNPSAVVIITRAKISLSNVVDTTRNPKIYLPNNNYAIVNENIQLKNVVARTNGLLNCNAKAIPLDEIIATHEKIAIC